MESPDPGFPIFVLCVALYRTEQYLSSELAALSRIKFEFWSHDAVVFHSHKIRKRVHPFEALRKREIAEAFHARLGNFFAESKVTLIAAAIDKVRHKVQYKNPDHPYNMSLQFCLERVWGHVQNDIKADDQVTFVFEKRGKREDALLLEKFKEYCASNIWNVQLPFRACFAAKEENISGLQVADLAAYPIARYVEKGNSERKDWQAILPRIRTGPNEKIDGYGLKIFPDPPLQTAQGT